MSINLPPQTCSSTSRAPGGACFGAVPWGSIGLLQDEAFGFIEDFLIPAEGADTLDGWTGTQYTAGDCQQLGDEGGLVSLSVGGSSQTDQGFQLQGGLVFEANADTMMAFGARMRPTDADKQNVVFGLSVSDSDMPANVVSTIADFIGFHALGDGNIDTQVNTSAGGHTAVDTGEDLADTTFVWLECLVDGDKNVHFFVDGARVETYTSSDVTVPVDTPLALSIANEATEDASNVLDVDIMYVAQWARGES